MLDNLIWIVLTSVCVASFSHFLTHCFKPGMIFDFYLPFIAKMLLKVSKEEHELMAKLCENHQDPKDCYERMFMEMLMSIPSKALLYKPLGGCGLCMSTWIFFFSCIPVYMILDISWWILIFYVLLCHFFFMTIFKISH